MQPRQPQMCRYGDSCNRFAQGTCKFLHPSQGGQGGQQGQQGQQGQGPRMMNPTRSFNQPHDGPRGQNYPPSDYQGGSQGNFQQQQSGWGGQQGPQQPYGKTFDRPQNLPPKQTD